MAKESFIQATLSPEQQAIHSDIEKILNVIEDYSIMENTDWPKFRATLREKIKDAKVFSDTYPALREALASLGDNHSSLWPPEKWKELTEPKPEDEPQLPTGYIKDGFAYIRIFAFTGTKTITPSNFIDHCHRLIEKLDAENPKGWIIDLRDECGGNCYPMIAGLGPLFEKNPHEDGLLGYFKMRKKEEAFGYKKGQMWSDTYKEDFFDEGRGKTSSPYHLKIPESPIAVLMGSGTASAKETVAVAAHGLKPRVRIFGADSGGYANANSSVECYTNLVHNDTKIILTTASYLDADKSPLGWTLKPEVYTDDPLNAAITWLYIEQILQCMESHSLKRTEIELMQRIRRELLEDTKAVTSIADTHPAIDKALAKLGDKHSQLVRPAAWEKMSEHRPPAAANLPTCEMVHGLAHFKMPFFNDQSPESHLHYIRHCHALIAEFEAKNPRGWVLDLRDNSGGNCWPMLAGIGPLLEEKQLWREGLLGYFRPQDGAPEKSWGYQNGQAWKGDKERAHKIIHAEIPKDEVHRLQSPAPPLAVLISKDTASSGEIVALACARLPHAKLFGGDSAGSASLISGLSLPDNALLLLATGFYADRHGNDYPELFLKPAVPTGQSTSSDPIPTEALRWIAKQTWQTWPAPSALQSPAPSPKL